ncbi:MAG TPA: PAS domain-containing protein [Methanoregula sp.]|nr:PAS domain-containing protein [Methanoregula sp.]
MYPPVVTTGSPTEALDGVSEWVLILQPDGIVGWSNRAFKEFMGGQAPGGTVWDIRHLFPADADRVLDDIRDVIETGQLRSGIIRPVQGINGERKVIRYTVIRHRDPVQYTSVIYLYGLDITDTVEMEELKKTAFSQIEKNIEQFAILGDHLRNPLTAIVGLCDLLEDREIAEKIQARAREIDDLITRIDRGWIDSEKVRNIIRKYYDIGAAGTHELVARAIHEEYIALQKKAKQTPETNLSMRPWDELPRRLKESNLRQVEDIWRAFHTINCSIALSTDSREPLFSFTESEVEFLSEREHEQWMAERKRKGWEYGRVRDDQQKIHDCIIPWEELPEAEREKDRNAVRALPGILAKVYLKIIRLDQGKY